MKMWKLIVLMYFLIVKQYGGIIPAGREKKHTPLPPVNPRLSPSGP